MLDAFWSSILSADQIFHDVCEIQDQEQHNSVSLRFVQQNLGTISTGKKANVATGMAKNLKRSLDGAI